MVSVQAYLCSKTMPLTWVGGAALEYVQDDAQVQREYASMKIQLNQVLACLLEVREKKSFVNNHLLTG